ncbi:hypothetical protein L1987_01399 [Smallanthus sonchifolius]|uniref:Uncharacterized protein n=1 Tax=Smallanthus sonchifolius TaxID=185202 RepID=A0ACB9K4S2_9ASTR|nr:hypothetical protein L1987_01399 [Smallanthus sonchifolius]
MGGDAWFGNMKSALARKGRNKAASSSTARAKKARQLEPETEQIPKPNWRKTEALCDQHEVWQEELYYEKMAGGLSSLDNTLRVEKAIRLSEFKLLGVYKCFERLGQIYKQNQGEEASRELKEILFQPGSLNKERKDLNILPKPCVVIGGHNIIPRTSDKWMVHVYELRVLAVLVSGVEMLSL